MKKVTFFIVSAITAIFLLISATSCKPEKGKFTLVDYYCDAIQTAAKDKSYIVSHLYFRSDNYISAQFSTWTFQVLDASGVVILEITPENYSKLSFALNIFATPIVPGMIGDLGIATPQIVNRDIFGGKTPKQLRIKTTIEDENQNKNEVEFTINIRLLTTT